MINIYFVLYFYNNRIMYMYYSFINFFLIRVMCRVVRKFIGFIFRMVLCCFGLGINSIILFCIIFLFAVRKWGCDIMIGVFGIGI